MKNCNKLYALRAGVAGAALSVPAIMGTITSFAAEGDSASASAVTALTGACSTMASDMTSAVTGIIPIALPVVGIVMVVVIGVKVFKRITSKA